MVSHEAVPWHEHIVFPTPEEVLESLAIDPPVVRLPIGGGALPAVRAS